MNSIRLRLCLAFILSLILTIFPLPAFLMEIRPPWVLLLFLYISFYKSEFFSPGMVVIIGLMLDVLLSTVLGEHAFALLLLTWFANNRKRRFSHFPLGHQIILIGILVLVYQITLFFIDSSPDITANYPFLFLNPVLAMLLWPWIKLFADAAFVFHTKLSRF